MPMIRWTLMPVLLLALAASAAAGGPVERAFNAPVDRVWTTTEAVLKHLGWDRWISRAIGAKGCYSMGEARAGPSPDRRPS